MYWTVVASSVLGHGGRLRCYPRLHCIDSELVVAATVRAWSIKAAGEAAAGVAARAHDANGGAICV